MAASKAKSPKVKSSAKPKAKTLPPREKVKVDDTWDLDSLFKNDEEWEAAFEKWKKLIRKSVV